MDAMYDLLGVLQYEVKELIKHFISERLISLQDIYDAIVSFPFGYADIANKPLQIADTTLSSANHKLKQTGKSLMRLFVERDTALIILNY